MSKKYHRIRLDGQEYKLRLTFGGQKRLREEFNLAPLDIIMTAANDERMLCALLGEALSWTGSGNAITDGEEFCDLLVDNGYAGQGRFNALVMDVAAASGILTAEHADRYQKSVNRMLDRAYNSAFDQLEQELDEPEDGENPTTASEA